MRDLFRCRELDIVVVNRETYIPLCVVNVMCVDLDPLAFILRFVSKLCIASKLVYSLEVRWSQWLLSLVCSMPLWNSS
jgi:hypothetical protein